MKIEITDETTIAYFERYADATRHHMAVDIAIKDARAKLSRSSFEEWYAALTPKQAIAYCAMQDTIEALQAANLSYSEKHLRTICVEEFGTIALEGLPT